MELQLFHIITTEYLHEWMYEYIRKRFMKSTMCVYFGLDNNVLWWLILVAVPQAKSYSGFV